MKKFIFASLVIALLLPVSVFALIAVKSYSDVTGNEWYADAVHYVTLNEWMSGNDNGTFAPERSVNRAEMATVLKRYDSEKAELLDGLVTIMCLNKNTFLDSATVSEEEVTVYAEALEEVCNGEDFRSTGCYDQFDPETGEVEATYCI